MVRSFVRPCKVCLRFPISLSDMCDPQKNVHFTVCHKANLVIGLEAFRLDFDQVPACQCPPKRHFTQVPYVPFILMLTRTPRGFLVDCRYDVS